MSNLKVYSKKEIILKSMSILYLFMSVLNTIFFNFTGIGSNLFYIGLVFFGGFGYSQNIAHLIMSMIFIFGSIGLWGCAYWNFFKKQREKIYCFALVFDIVISTVWAFWAYTFVFWKFLLSVAFCVIFFRLRKTIRNTGDHSM